MIRLPKLDITRDELAEAKLVVKAQAWQEAEERQRLEGLHASDLVDPRLAYWQWADPKETPERTIWFFLVGKVLHHFVLHMDQPIGGMVADEGTKEALGILYSPDKNVDGRPTELKTSRAQTEPDLDSFQDDQSHYFEQLVTYLVLENTMIGYLWIFFISLREREGYGRTNPAMRCYKVSLTEEQFYQIEAEVLAARDRLLWAKEHRNPSRLEYCRSWKCGDGRCSYWEVCRPIGRYGLQRKEWQI